MSRERGDAALRVRRARGGAIESISRHPRVITMNFVSTPCSPPSEATTRFSPIVRS